MVKEVVLIEAHFNDVVLNDPIYNDEDEWKKTIIRLYHIIRLSNTTSNWKCSC